jgi:hypothetical protein
MMLRDMARRVPWRWLSNKTTFTQSTSPIASRSSDRLEWRRDIAPGAERQGGRGQVVGLDRLPRMTRPVAFITSRPGRDTV